MKLCKYVKYFLTYIENFRLNKKVAKTIVISRNMDILHDSNTITETRKLTLP